MGLEGPGANERLVEEARPADAMVGGAGVGDGGGGEGAASRAGGIDKAMVVDADALICYRS